MEPGRLLNSKKLPDCKLPKLKQPHVHCSINTSSKFIKKSYKISKSSVKPQLNSSYTDISLIPKLNNSISFIKKKPFHVKTLKLAESIYIPRLKKQVTMPILFPPFKPQSNPVPTEDFKLCAWETKRKSGDYLEHY